MTNVFLTLIIPYLIALVTLISSLNINSNENLYSFECGFNPFNNSQTPFSIQFFNILLIFLLFDIEIIVVLPLPLFNSIIAQVNTLIIVILLLLISGLLYEWNEGSLQWLN